MFAVVISQYVRDLSNIELAVSFYFQGRSPRRLWQSTGAVTALPLPPSTRTSPLLEDQTETQSSRRGSQIRNNLQIFAEMNPIYDHL